MAGMAIPDLVEEILIRSADGFHGCLDGGGAECMDQYLHGRDMEYMDIPANICHTKRHIEEYIRR